ncbi:MAG: hypothetical protein M1837_001105 [Sclerophora amabilis]|nr:MAG: hypothetical protein M1837_001105 [Sclerophora amabilis]
MRTPQSFDLYVEPGNNANMPSDKQNNHNSSRPLMPTLSGSNKTGRPPLTPRLAGSPSATSSPGLRRVAQSDRPSRSSTDPKEDISTPVKSFLSTNITPRSSSRKARVDSASSTPSGTPTDTPSSSRPTSTVGVAGSAAGVNNGTTGLGLDTLDFTRREKPGSSMYDGRSSTSAVRGGSPDRPELRARQHTDSPSIFYANHAKALSESSQPITGQAASQSKTNSFFYANGEETPSQQPPLAANSPVAIDRAQGKFFHINDLRGNNASLSHSPGSHSLSSPSLSRPTPSHGAQFSPGSPPAQYQPTSPPKPGQGVGISGARGVTLSPLTQTRPIPSPLGRNLGPLGVTGSKQTTDTSQRRSSIESSTQRSGHGRSISVGSSNSTTPAKRTYRPSSSEVSLSPKSPSTTTGSGIVGSPEDVPEEQAENALAGNAENSPTSPICPSKPFPPLASPPPKDTPNTQNRIQQLNEAAASARRERKVLDLEISNSSLLAINRTLEREMRKQTAELRRYRRLSRSGRLSLDPRDSTGRLSEASSTMTKLSSLTEEDENSDEDEDLFSSRFSSDEGSDEDDDDDDSSLSPTARAESDARHRTRDEARLQLDLAKHQQLLVASQAMNQSLKRCLGWTEELLGEGKKALDYKVRVSDVRLGGRVLAPEEREEERGKKGGQTPESEIEGASLNIEDRPNETEEKTDHDRVEHESAYLVSS